MEPLGAVEGVAAARRPSRWSRRQLITAGGLGGALALACGPAPGVPRGRATGTEGPGAGRPRTEIIYWASWTGAFEEMVKRIAAAFMAKNPDVQVTHLVIPGAEMDAKILTGVAANNPPDVAMIWGAQRVYSLADLGALQALEDSLDRTELSRFRSWVHPPIWDLGTYQGKTYAVPQWCQSYCVIWSKDLVEAAGLDATRGPRTTDELFDWATKLTKRRSDGTIEVLGFFDAWLQRQMSIFHGRFHDEATDKIVLDDPANVETLEYIVRYANAYDPKLLADYRQALTGAAQGTLHPLLAGRQAMEIEGPWDLGVFKETKPDFRYGVAPLPVKPGRGRGWWTYGDIPCIIKQTKQPAAAGRYVTFLTGFGGEEEYASLYLMPPKGGGRPHNPISKTLIETPAWRPVLEEYPGYDQYMETAFSESTNYVLTPPKIPVASFLITRLTAHADRAILGQVTPRQAMADAQQEIAAEYTRYKRLQGRD
jgi:multiple sugar transport system substrate-binding protein